MLYRFPPSIADQNDPTFLCGDEEVFAKLKIESAAGKRTVYMTEHTLIFVLKGTKLLHFADKTLEVTANSVFLLKKGIYVMAEYFEADLAFEALMIFLPEKILKQFLPVENKITNNTPAEPYIIFPVTALIHEFKTQFRQYFEHHFFNYENLIPLKQKEIITLLLSSGYRRQVHDFLVSAVSPSINNLDFVINHYLLQPVTIAELANLCNRSLASFKRDFQKLYHSAPRVYINHHRLMHAKMLLQNTEQRIAEISNACGFESSSYFIKLFKKEFGLTPTKMRANIVIL